MLILSPFAGVPHVFVCDCVCLCVYQWMKMQQLLAFSSFFKLKTCIFQSISHQQILLKAPLWAIKLDIVWSFVKNQLYSFSES